MSPPPSPLLHRFPSGLQAVLLPLPNAVTASVSAFVRSGSVDEPRALNGIGHVVEHMVFKGTRARTAHQINLDAERRGAEVNAHTDKDHSAFHMRGLPPHALDFLPMLADLLLAPTFPADELERERQVLLQEFAEDEDDPMATAYRLFDTACYGLHPLAQPAIGRRANIERFTRDDLVAWTARQFTAANTVVAAAGPLDAEAFFARVDAAFGGMTPGTPHAAPEPPAWRGGLKTRHMDAGQQAHLVLGFPLPALAADDPAGELLALALGEGMSSPLMHELREQRGLVYYAACAADLLDVAGELVIEASFGDKRLPEVLEAISGLLDRQAQGFEAVDLERAQQQFALRLARGQERPGRVVEAAVLDLLALGRVRAPADRLAAAMAVDRAALGQALDRALKAGAAAALAGSLPRGAGTQARAALAALLRAGD
ncbi:M16 family metallopeptidase [Rubrivivax albus]|uniref:Insulinase family protein n=1 Tax=Rubrivivax albus TaxID=2499835 RepID=A0A437K0C3_9BURK|nr:pitrilysin family protein [Rubrivivax albus]RVT53731.1 insulinase family protein [Rubrivivax albus]